MSRRPARFTQADIARALRAFEQVNGVRGTVEFQADGAIRIVPADHKAKEPTKIEPSRDFVL
jgi:hypothetical protein